MPLSQAVAEHRELVDKHLGSVVGAGENVFAARNAAEWEGGAFVYVPAGVKVDAPIVLDAIQAQAGTRAELARAGRARGGRRGRGLGAVRLDRARPVHHRRRARRRPERAPALRLRPGPRRGLVDLRHPARDASPATASSTGSCSASARATARSSRTRSSRARAPRARSPAPTRTRGRQHLDFDTTQEHAAANCISRPRLPRDPRRPLERGLARDDQGRPRRPADRRLPGVAQPAADQEGPRRRDPGPRDPRQRRALHPRRGDRPDRPRPALLPARARAGARTSPRGW